jgi:ribonuclease HI
VAMKVVRSGNEVRVAEALGILEALKFTIQHQLRSVIIESDAQVCIQAIHNKQEDRSYWGKIIHSCILMSSSLDRIEFCWVRRSGNQAAHETARWAAIDPDRYWTHSFPRPIFTHIQNDMTL